MDSPFPGMDPYQEGYWRDVHTRIVMYVGDQIQEKLPSDLVARVEESVTVDFAEESRMIAPDVLVSEIPDMESEPSSAGSVRVAEPLVVLEEVPQTARHIKIVDLKHGGRIVTVIEVLSPINKMTIAGRDEYRRKQREYVQAGVNLVEIDLLRCGEHVLSAAWELIPSRKRRTYMFSVRTRTRTTVFGASLREPLPVIPIPLRPEDQKVALDLQAIVRLVYERGRYGNLNYQKDPEPPFSEEDAAWVDSLLRSSSRRSS